MGGRGRSGKVRSRGKEASAREVPQINKNVWKEVIREDADKEGVGPCDRYERRVHTEERKGERKERRSKRICERAVAKRVHMAIKVTTNGTSILYGEKNGKKQMVQDYRYLNK